MPNKAGIVMAGLALVALLGLLRLGLIDRPAEIAMDGGAALGVAPARPPATPVAAGSPEAIAVRAWLRAQMGQPASLKPERVLEILEDLDEDREDKTRVQLFPSGRSIAKAELRREPLAWDDLHLWPVSRGLGEAPAPALLDLHNLRLAEPGLAELQRTRDFDDVGEPSASPAGLRVDARGLEPPDALKGDVARTLFYMAVRYGKPPGGSGLELVAGSSSEGEPALGRLCTLLRWSDADPVDEAERRRNDWIARRQGSRNPFVERPEFARVLWGRECR